MYKRGIYLLVFLCSFSVLSQEHADDEIGTVMRRDVIAGINFNTSGWGIVVFYGLQKNYKYKNTIGFTLTNIRHPKEEKIYSGLGNSKGYYYGKLNSLLAFRPTFGGKLVLFKSRRENGIEVAAKWHFGPSIGLVKPVYLRIDKLNSIPMDERYDPSIHHVGNIASRSSWFKGLGESTLNLGAFAKLGFDFDFSQIKHTISGGEFGVMIDYYAKGVQLLHLNDRTNLFTCLYLQFNIGQKIY